MELLIVLKTRCGKKLWRPIYFKCFINVYREAATTKNEQL